MTKNIDFENIDYYKSKIKEKALLIEKLKQKSFENEMFLFFTDLHECLLNTKDNDKQDKIQNSLDILNECYNAVSPEFIMCGGDLLNNGDTKSSAIYKLSSFNMLYRRTFKNSFFLVGNHDTNYQGDTFIKFKNWQDCILDQKTINSIFYDNGKSYYSFRTNVASYYCFDSGLDWLDFQTSEYQAEQIKWFADSLLTDNKAHKVIFIHMVFKSDEVSLISMMEKIEKIVIAYNAKTTLTLDNVDYDYKNTVGFVEFIQAGHSHMDNSSLCGGNVPIVVTTSFSYPEAVSRFTFDIVFADYTNSKLYCFRIGDGNDRIVKLGTSERSAKV